MSERKFVIIFDSWLFMNVLTLQEEWISGGKTKAFCQVPRTGKHRVWSIQAKEEVRVTNSKCQVEQNLKASNLNQSVGKGWNPDSYQDLKKIWI